MDCNITKPSNSNEPSVHSNETRRRVPELRGTKRKQPEEDKAKVKCHFCRHKKMPIGIVVCLNYSTCHHAFCYDCISKRFRNKERRRQSTVLSKNWVCFTCRGLCHCERCKLDLVKELSILNKHAPLSPQDPCPPDSKSKFSRKGVAISADCARSNSVASECKDNLFESVFSATKDSPKSPEATFQTHEKPPKAEFAH